MEERLILLLMALVGVYIDILATLSSFAEAIQMSTHNMIFVEVRKISYEAVAGRISCRLFILSSVVINFAMLLLALVLLNKLRCHTHF